MHVGCAMAETIRKAASSKVSRPHAKAAQGMPPFRMQNAHQVAFALSVTYAMVCAQFAEAANAGGLWNFAKVPIHEVTRMSKAAPICVAAYNSLHTAYTALRFSVARIAHSAVNSVDTTSLTLVSQHAKPSRAAVEARAVFESRTRLSS